MIDGAAVTTFVADIAKAEVAIVELTNVFRRENGAAEVRREPKLDAAARAYAAFLAQSGLFSHEADGRRPSDRIDAAGYGACASAENLALLQRDNGFETRELAVRFVEGWKGSPGHRRNMLMETATETGVGVVKARSAEKYVSVQLFGRPVSLQFDFRVRNEGGRAVGYQFGGERFSIAPRETITHTSCVPGEVTFAAGALGAKSAAAKFPVHMGFTLSLVRQPDGTMKAEPGGK